MYTAIQRIVAVDFTLYKKKYYSQNSMHVLFGKILITEVKRSSLT